MRILVVDDELSSREKMRRIIEGFGECVPAEDGTSAIAAFKDALNQGAPFRLITLDILMPGMDGTQVLLEIREMEDNQNIPKPERVKIIMVTSLSDRDSLITCIQAGCDDYVIKPFDRLTIARKLKRFGLEPLAGEVVEQPPPQPPIKVDIGLKIIRQLHKGELILPSPPLLFLEFNELVDQGADVHQLADLLKQDLSVSFQIIGVSNSPYYRGVTESKNIEEAICRLGIETTQRYVNLISVRSMYAINNRRFQKSMDMLWRHSLACAHCSEIVANLLKLQLSEDPFTIGLFHDIGKLILLQIIGELEWQGECVIGVDEMDLQVTLDTYHEEFGASVLRKWEFSNGLVEVARFHDQLEEVEPITKQLLVVHFANQLVKSMGYSAGPPVEIDMDNLTSRQLLNLEVSMLDDIKQQVESRMTSSDQFAPSLC